MNHEFNFLQQLEAEIRAEWAIAPFQFMAGIEVFENMSAVIEGHEYEMEEVYITVRNNILRQTIPNRRIALIAPLARSGDGKGDFNKGMMRCMSNDYLLNNYVDKAGEKIPFKVITMPVSMYAQAAKLPRIQSEHPEFAVDPKKQNHEYTEEDLEKISALMLYDYEKYVIRREGGEGVGFTSKDSGVVIMEPGSMTSVPAEITEIKKKVEDRNSYGREIVGVDRGQGALYGAIRESQKMGMERGIFLFGIEKTARVNQFADNWRNLLKTSDKVSDLKKIFGRDVKVVFSVGEEKSEFDVEYIPQHLQKIIINFIKKTMVLPPGTTRSRNDFEQMKYFLFDEGLLDSPTDESYFSGITHALGLGGVFLLRNPYWPGHKTWDMDYFYRYSLPAQVYPELVEELNPVIAELSKNL